MFKLSIIVPIFNGDEYLKRCIDSILSQQYADFELILVDDGSTDNSLSICNGYAESDGRVVVHHKENEGLVAARKTGVSLAKGEYIGFVDCDDYIDGDMYFNLMASAEKDKADIVTGGIIFEYESELKVMLNQLGVGYYDEKAIKNKIIPRMLIHSGFVRYGVIPGVVTKVFRRSVLEKALPNVSDKLTIGEDVAITAYSMMNAKSLSIIGNAGYHYIQTAGSMIRAYNPKRLEKISDLYSCISKIENESYQKQVSLYMCYLIFGAVASCIKNSGLDKKETVNMVRDILKSDLSLKVFKEADISKLSFKNKIKIIMMKHNLVRLIMLFV
ncbi:MAG: glycosyltransferase family 2 protein [Clostridia bacterium]|nr:glycosyltransferase family 2 protein [Clostridia bacterium]